MPFMVRSLGRSSLAPLNPARPGLGHPDPGSPEARWRGLQVVQVEPRAEKCMAESRGVALFFRSSGLHLGGAADLSFPPFSGLASTVGLLCERRFPKSWSEEVERDLRRSW